VSFDAIVVGAPGVASDTGCATDGDAYTYHRSGTGWDLATIVHEPETTGGNACFGAAVGVDGTIAVLGAPYDDGSAADGGGAYVLERSGATWTITTPLLTIPPPHEDTQFGSSLDISGNAIIVGAPGVAAYVFERAPVDAATTLRFNSKWEQNRIYFPPDATPADSMKFGYSVAIVPGAAVVGAPGADPDGALDAGAVYPADSAPLPLDVCGDDVLSPSEACDDGDTTWKQGQGCNADCEKLLCGDPNDSGTITSGDALFVLRTAVGSAVCDVAVCDVNGNGTITTGDALAILRKAVGTPVTLHCP
jgi:cysteine-rich repeat protein